MTAKRSRWRLVAIFAMAFLALASVLVPYMMRTESELHIRVAQQGLALPDGFYLYQRLDEQGIRIKSITPERDAMVIRLDSPEQQLLAHQALQTILPPGYTIAWNESSPTHHWGRQLTRLPLNLG